MILLVTIVTVMCVFQGCDAAGCRSNSDVGQRCTDALRWACRLVPFSRFLKAEELLQDLVLSLVSELPPSTMVTIASLNTEHLLHYSYLADAFIQHDLQLFRPSRGQFSHGALQG